MDTLQNKIRCLIIISSYHHNNTEKVAQTLANVLNANLKAPNEVTEEELEAYNLIGFGSGIDSGKHYMQILSFVDSLSIVDGKKSFIFSTSAIQGKDKVYNDHLCLRSKLISKGFNIVDEFSCKGFNTNSFLKFLGGMNKGRPNSDDLQHAKEFAYQLLK